MLFFYTLGIKISGLLLGIVCKIWALITIDNRPAKFYVYAYPLIYIR